LLQAKRPLESGGIELAAFDQDFAKSLAYGCVHEWKSALTLTGKHSIATPPPHSERSEECVRGSAQVREYFRREGNGRGDIVAAVRCRHKARLECARREIHPASSIAWKKRLKRALSQAITAS
jgi:hypothetical protein